MEYINIRGNGYDKSVINVKIYKLLHIKAWVKLSGGEVLGI